MKAVVSAMFDKSARSEITPNFVRTPLRYWGAAWTFIWAGRDAGVSIHWRAGMGVGNISRRLWLSNANKSWRNFY